MTTALWIFAVLAVIDLGLRLWWVLCNAYPRRPTRFKADDGAWIALDLLLLGLIAYDLVPA